MPKIKFRADLMRWVSSLLLAVAVMPTGAGAVKSKSLAQA
jgi:hypothetical protein